MDDVQTGIELRCLRHRASVMTSTPTTRTVVRQHSVTPVRLTRRTNYILEITTTERRPCVAGERHVPDEVRVGTRTER
jgi:hypothetical protein